MKTNPIKTAVVSLTLMLMGTGPALAGSVNLIGATGNTCSSYTNFKVDANGNLTVSCSQAPSPTPVPTPTPTAAPSCVLTASPATISPGASSTLTAICTPAATSYIWTGPGMSGFSTASARGTVRPTGTTPYSVTGVNSVGTGNTDTKTVTVSKTVSRTGAPPSASAPLADIKAWIYAFETLNYIPHNYRDEPVSYMSYLKLIQSNKPTIIHLPTSW